MNGVALDSKSTLAVTTACHASLLREYLETLVLA